MCSSDLIENDRAADEEYPDRVVAAIEGALRSVAARIAGARRPTGNAMLCAPAFTSTSLVRISTSLGRGYVPMSELTAALGAAAEEAVSKRYQTPISAETVDTSNLYGAEFESRVIRVRLPEQRRSAVLDMENAQAAVRRIAEDTKALESEIEEIGRAHV